MLYFPGFCLYKNFIRNKKNYISFHFQIHADNKLLSAEDLLQTNVPASVMLLKDVIVDQLSVKQVFKIFNCCTLFFSFTFTLGLTFLALSSPFPHLLILSVPKGS